MNKILFSSVILLVILSSGCSDSNEKIECGAGKHEENGVCVENKLECGAGKHEENGVCVEDKLECGAGKHEENGVCVEDKLECGAGKHEENGVCVEDKIECGTGKHEENGVCVEDKLECGTGKHEENGVCVEDKNGETDGPIDPCQGVTCPSGTCQQGICVTEAMKNVKAEDACDTETYVEFCDGKRTYYCDQGMIMIETCNTACVVYEETVNGIVRRQSGCVDGGSCTQLNEIKRSCERIGGSPTVLVTACQRTTANTLQYVSVDGYYCKEACDAKGEQCALAENECDPYDLSAYVCEGKTLQKCYRNSNLIAEKRLEYCRDSCVSVNGMAMCGTACDEEESRNWRCVNAGSTDYFDQGDFICKKTDSGDLYSVWTGNYEFCADGCDSATGECL